MTDVHTPDTLRAFEARVARAFDAGDVRAPVHLGGGNEEHLIRYFAEHYRPGDYVFGTWRAHYHALLAGVPEEELYEAILRGHSISLCFPAQRVLCSAIVAGHVPIALGVAMGLKRKSLHRWSVAGDTQLEGPGIEAWVEATDEDNALRQGSIIMAGCRILGAVRHSPVSVHCFVGDMAAETGLFHECRKYAIGHDLPISFVVEDNGLSVCTPTREAWGSAVRATGSDERQVAVKGNLTTGYAYELPWPHSGAGRRVNF